MPKIIDGILQKELFCKNDECMNLFGYFRVYKGIISITCRKCAFLSVWRIDYSKGQENIDKLGDMVHMKGQE